MAITFFLPLHGLFLLVLLFFSIAQRAQCFCYVPDGGLASDVPCNSNGNSTCCAKGFGCTTNNLCLDNTNMGPSGESLNDMYVRGTCTDENWQSDACSQICITKQPDSGERVVHCGGGMYCCDNDAPNCCKDNSVQKFDLGEPQIYAVVGSNNLPISASGASLVSGTTAPSPVSGPSSASPSNTVPATTSSAATAETKQESSKIIAVGLGVGIPLGLLLVGSFGAAIWWMKRMEKRFQNREDEMRQQQLKAVELDSMIRDSRTTRGGRHASRYELETEKYAQHAEMPC